MDNPIRAAIDGYAAALRETPSLLRHEWMLWRIRHREDRLWASADTWEATAELVAKFCEGRLGATPNHGGERDPETITIGHVLAHANRSGFLTHSSQPGERGDWGEQRAAVTGFASAETAEKLRRLFAGTRVVVRVAEPATRREKWAESARFAWHMAKALATRTDGNLPDDIDRNSVDVTRTGDHVHTDFGHVFTRDEAARQFPAIGQELSEALQILIYDPAWGGDTLLWDRLGANWDNPPAVSAADRVTPEVPEPPRRDPASITTTDEYWAEQHRIQAARVAAANRTGEDCPMPRHIPPGREDLWRRQAESDADLDDLDAAVEAAERKRNELADALGWDDALTENADRRLGELIDERNRAGAVNDRIYAERLAGLTPWIDHDPTAPICRECGGTGGPPGHDAHSACKTCRGWGREDDGRPPIPVWSDTDKQWINPATGRPVDLLADERAVLDPPHPDVPSWDNEPCGRPGCSGQMVANGGEAPHYDEGDAWGSVGTRCSNNCGMQSGHDWEMSDEDYEAEFGHPFDERPEACPECGGDLDLATATYCTRCGEDVYEDSDGPDETTGPDFEMPPAAQPWIPPAPRDTTEPDPQGDTGMNSKQVTGQTWWDRFFTWFDSLWGWPTGETSDETSPPGGSTGRVSAALTYKPGPVKTESTADTPQTEDTRPQPQPQDLDALTKGSKEPGWVWIPQLDGGRYNPQPLSVETLAPPAVTESRDTPSHRLEDVVEPRWCNCTGRAHEVHCTAQHYADDFATGLDDIPSPSQF